MYVQSSIGSRNSAIHNVYHTSLRPSSLLEPRHLSLKVVHMLSQDPRKEQDTKLCFAALMDPRQQEQGADPNKEVPPALPPARSV